MQFFSPRTRTLMPGAIAEISFSQLLGRRQPHIMDRLTHLLCQSFSTAQIRRVLKKWPMSVQK